MAALLQLLHMVFSLLVHIPGDSHMCPNFLFFYNISLTRLGSTIIASFFFFFFFGCFGCSLLCAGFLQLQRAGATLRCGVQAPHCGGFSCGGARALGTRASVVVARRLSSCGSWALECRLSSCGSRA